MIESENRIIALSEIERLCRIQNIINNRRSIAGIAVAIEVSKRSGPQYIADIYIDLGFNVSTAQCNTIDKILGDLPCFSVIKEPNGRRMVSLSKDIITVRADSYEGKNSALMLDIITSIKDDKNKNLKSPLLALTLLAIYTRKIHSYKEIGNFIYGHAAKSDHPNNAYRFIKALEDNGFVQTITKNDHGERETVIPIKFD